ncbi:hypothetical protein MY4824_007469 [Beauveria thailandica]
MIFNLRAKIKSLEGFYIINYTFIIKSNLFSRSFKK